MPRRLYSTYQVADLLGATASEVAEWIRRRWLPALQYPDGPVRISEEGLIEFLKQRGVDVEAVFAKQAADEGQAGEDLEQVHEGQVVSVSSVGPPLLAAPSAAIPGPPVGAPSPADAPGQAPAAKPVSDSPAADAAAKVAEAVLKDAVSRHASHIHLELRPDGLSLRLRIDGVLHDKANFSRRLPRALGAWVVERFMELAGAGPAPDQGPQAGSFAQTFDGREVVCHLSACPTLHGQKLVIHLLDRRRALLELSQLGLSAEDESTIRRLLAEPAGLVLVTGPPRSGTTTTLLAMLAALDSPGRNVVAIEDSVELDLHGLVQSRPSVGFSSAQALRAFAAQDADVIMVGEIRDSAVAAAAVEAAVAGRLVLGAMRAGSAPAAAGALLAMGVDPGALSSALLAAIAQRLVRKLCGECKRQVAPSKKLMKEVSLQPAWVGTRAHAAEGCPRCSHTGYSGRRGLFSVMAMDQAIAALLRGGADAEALQEAAVRHGMKSLRQAAAEMIRTGLTSLEEVARALPKGD